MALNEIAAGIGFGVICLGSCAGCYYMMGETARQDINNTLNEEKENTKEKLKKMKKILDKGGEGQDDGALQKLQAKILVYPKKMKDLEKVPQVRAAAEKENELIEQLFEQLDTSGDKRLDVEEMREFVRELAKALMEVGSGLDKPRTTKAGRSTPNCLSRKEKFLVGPIVAFVMAGADVGGELDGQVDLKEFKTLMTFLKVVLCRKDGHYRLKQIGLEGNIMTTDAWLQVLDKIVQVRDAVSSVYDERNASATEREDSSDDDPGGSDDSEGSDSDDGSESEPESSSSE